MPCTSRGNAREDIFDEDGDRKTLLEILGKAVTRFTWLCHAYRLMDNHQPGLLGARKQR